MLFFFVLLHLINITITCLVFFVCKLSHINLLFCLEKHFNLNQMPVSSFSHFYMTKFFLRPSYVIDLSSLICRHKGFFWSSLPTDHFEFLAPNKGWDCLEDYTHTCFKTRGPKVPKSVFSVCGVFIIHLFLMMVFLKLIL